MKYEEDFFLGAIKKIYKNLTTSRQPRKLIFSIEPYLTQLDEICQKNTDWGTVKNIKKI